MTNPNSRRRIALALRGLIACLTICQFAAVNAAEPGTTRSKTKARRTSKQQTKAVRGQQYAAAPAPAQYYYSAANSARPAPQAVRPSYDMTLDNSDYSTQARYRDFTPARHGWLTDDQTALKPVPTGGMFIAAASMMGSSYRSSVSGQYLGSMGNTMASVQTTGYTYGPSVGLMYGFTDNFYVSATGSYSPGHSEYSTNLYTVTSHTTSNNSGWREPSLALGATMLVLPGTRLTAEINGSIPVGAAHSETRGNDTTENGLSGGGTVGPSIFMVSRLGYVKLIGNVSYDFQLERRAEDVNNGITTNKSTSGGNRLSSVLGIEFPELLNFGTAVLFSNTEASTTTSTASYLGSYSTSRTGVSSQVIAGAVYMGIPIDAAHLVLMPKVAYTTAMGHPSADGLTLDRSDAWIFGLQSVFHF